MQLTNQIVIDKANSSLQRNRLCLCRIAEKETDFLKKCLIKISSNNAVHGANFGKRLRLKIFISAKGYFIGSD
jgi:hypothetical protein